MNKTNTNQSQDNWFFKNIDLVYSELETSSNGLSNSEASMRLLKNGPNRIHEHKIKPVWLILIHQFSDFMIIVLFFAAAIAGIIGEIADTFVILTIIVLNAIIGFIQEFNAEKAIASLKKMNALYSLVLRNNIVITMPAENIVVGDVIILEAGNIVPADLRLIETAHLKIEEASLTGESHAVEKKSETLYDKNLTINDRINMAYKSTLIANGRGLGVVVATGMNTEIGKIASLLGEDEIETPLQKRLKTFGKNLSFVILLICISYFAFGVWHGEEVLRLLLTSVSLAIAAIPEALPAFVVIVLAFGAKRMMKQKVLIRKLPSVETLGSVTYICSDKTGTLTENKMSVEEIYAKNIVIKKNEIINYLDNSEIKILLSAMALNNDVSVSENETIIGDPTEVALYLLPLEHQYRKWDLIKKFPRVAEIPFDSNRKCMTTIHKWGNEYIAFTKGAVEVIIAKSDLPTKTEKEQFLMQADKMASEGLRVIGFGYRKITKLPEKIIENELEQNLIVIGICGMMDPPREEAKEAIKNCKTAGIKTVMITGDHLLTGKAIAKRLGIIESEKDMVVNGQQLAAMTEMELKENVKNIKVYARVSPEQKLSIVKALQENGEFVAMTGDGVNDAPSLKRADIGVAMGITGTDVSKEAAHMILLDDNFATIVKAIREGRRIYDNIRKFVKYILTGNSAEVWVILLASLLSLPIPLLPIHILWINLVTDGLPGLALAAEPAEKNIMNKPPRHPKESIFANGLWFYILWVGFLTGAISFGMQIYGINSNSHWQTMVFATICFSQLGLVLTIRSDSQSLFKIGIFSNMYVIFVIVFTIILQFATIYVPFFNSIFKTEPLSLKEILVVLGVSLIVFFTVELHKLFLRLREKRKIVVENFKT